MTAVNHEPALIARWRLWHREAVDGYAVAMEFCWMPAETVDRWLDGDESLPDGIGVGPFQAVGVNGVAFAAVLKTAIAHDLPKAVFAHGLANHQAGGKLNGGSGDLDNRRQPGAEKEDRPNCSGKKLGGAYPAERTLTGKYDGLTASWTKKTINKVGTNQ